MSFNPTPEQQAIIDAAKETSDNLLVSALAGAAKTSTLVLVAEALKKVPTLCLAFNKRIAVEMQERLPGNCEAMTLNGLGHRVWGKAIGKRLIVDTKKNYNILTGLLEDIKSKKERDEAYEVFADVLRAIGAGKTCGYVPDGHYTHGKSLMGDDEFFSWLEEEPTALMERLIRDATLESLKQSYAGRIDFDDQILMPTVFQASFPQYPLVMIDEAQDLSALNHATLRKLARKRLIAVGDECQSIYGFRGAHQDSMNLLKHQFNMRELILSVSFRCPKSVVEEARWRAPHMKYPDWAKPGVVKHLTSWSADDLPDTAVILCRNNAPIFSMAIKLLKNGRYPEVVGNDIGKALIKTLKKFGPEQMLRQDVLAAIEAWTKEKLKKARNEGKIYDQAACLRIFAEQGENLGDAIAYAEHVMTVRGPVKLMTIHKSKGLEFPLVYIMDRDLIKLDEVQEQNLLYVGQTRSQGELYYVDSANFEEEEHD